MVLWLLLALQPSGQDDGYAYPPLQRGAMVARLTVRAPEGSGPSRVYYTLTVQGGRRLEVEAPQLADPMSDWKARRSASWTAAGEGVTWTESVELEQVKPGRVSPPDVKLRFRDAPTEPWQQAEWKDILKDIRELPVPVTNNPASAGPAWPWLAALAAVVAAMLLVATLLRFRRRRAEVRLAADHRALRELERLEGLAAMSDTKIEWLFARVSEIIRQYLTERFELPALQQTTTEFLQSVTAATLLADEKDALREVLERCDLAKFAGARSDRAEWIGTVEQVRAFVRRTAPTTVAPSFRVEQTLTNRDT